MVIRMDIDVQRLATPTQLYFTSDTHPQLSGIANRIRGISTRYLEVIDQDLNSRWILRQENKFKNVLSYLPIGDFRCCYEMYINGMHVGKSVYTRFYTQTLFWENDSIHELFYHSNGSISMMKDNIQVGLLKKEKLTFNGRSFYRGSYEKQAISPGMLMLWIEYIDVTFHQTQDFSLFRFDKAFSISGRKEPFRERLNWKAQD